MIAYLADSRTFFLQGPRSSYVLAITRHGHLQHLHWGARVQPGALDGIAPLIDRAFSPNPLAAGHGYSLDTLGQECPTGGLTDFRSPAVLVEHPDGTQALELVYESHAIAAGKPKLAGLPATYVEAAGEADTLSIVLADRASGVRVELSYTQFRDHDAVSRSLRIVNAGDAPRCVLRALSASLDLPPGERSLMTLNGAWARERHVDLTPLRPGTQGVGSRRGTSSHQHNPFIAVVDAGTTEEHGEARGLALAYSGCFLAQAEVDQFAEARVQIGLDAPAFRWRLAPGAAFQAPEALLVWSGDGLGGMSRTFHRLLRTRMARGRYRDAQRPILINNWEATYFNFDTEKLVAIAAKAKEIGVEMMVLDDGWFGARKDDKAGLGDWVCNEAKLPGGLKALADRIEGLGMRFGLWFEPEMVNPDSDLYRAHPDWCLHIPGRDRSTGRSQLVLDLARPEVADHVYRSITAVLRSARISYVKWDMNRHLTEVASPAFPAGEVHHRYVLALYAMLERITAEFPDVLFESCSGGGGRFDAGLLHYMPQVWTSDNSDAICRLDIQHGTSMAYPLSSMGAHVSACPNHQVHRTTPMLTRGHVAFTGAFGFELDLNKLSPEDLATARAVVAEYNRVRDLLAGGDLYRLRAPADRRAASWMVVAPDRSRALVTWVSIVAEANAPFPVLRLRGLDPSARYRVDGEVVGGDVLMSIGLRPRIGHDFTSRTWHLERV
ncbi:MAG: alpha-galactosidase [Planctomycetes bacterium]|nr:alpha-galactosidase [Planctomycetota bacterium]